MNDPKLIPACERFQIEVHGRHVPGVLWVPDRPRALILACHGGSGHKESNAIRLICGTMLPRGCAVAAIDGPVHGERRADGERDPETMRKHFRSAWVAGVGRREMVEDWRATLDWLQRQPALRTLPVGWIGVSMGTAYGLPFLAEEPRVRAAVLGLWSTNFFASEHLAAAARQVRCATWFTQQWNDQLFDRLGTAELFDALASADKRLVVYPGLHEELSGERLEDATSFLIKRLLASGPNNM